MPDDPNKPASDPAASPAGGASASGATDGAQTPPPGDHAPAGSAQARMFSQEDVNRIAAQAREEGRQSAQRKQQGGQPAEPGTEPQPQSPKPGANGNGNSEPMADMVARELARAIQAAGFDPLTVASRQAGYSDAQIAVMRPAYDSARPADTAKWLSEWAQTVNLKPAAAAAAGNAAASSGTAPRKVEDMRDEGGLIDVFALSPEQVMTMGPARIREEFEKTLTRARELSGAPPLPAAMRSRK